MAASCKKERTCAAPHVWVQAVPELRRHCTTCGTEQKGYEENGKVVWENVPQTVYDPCS